MRTAESQLADAQARLNEQRRKLMELSAPGNQPASPRQSASPRAGEAGLHKVSRGIAE